jgi:UPF0271 protein
MDVDLNCDLGEGSPCEQELLSLVTSANVSCGFHAGNPLAIRSTLEAARKLNVQVGAHPGFNDPEHFGRRELARTRDEVVVDCLYQCGALRGLAEGIGIELKYLKPHGALYHQASRDARIAEGVVAAARALRLGVMGFPGSQMELHCAAACPFIPEGFVDRRYQPDGLLLPRSTPRAMLDDPAEAVQQAESLIRTKGVKTLCVHGDNPRALELIRAVRAGLVAAGHTIRAFDVKWNW